MKTILFVAMLALMSPSCSSPVAPSQTGSTGGTGGTGSNGGTGGSSTINSVAIVSLAPVSAAVGTRVTVRGSGFAAEGNTIEFAAVTVSGDMPNSPSVIPGLPSSDRITITFDVPALWRPACSYGSSACPFARIPTSPGTYRVTVTNAAGTSNGMAFAVTP